MIKGKILLSSLFLMLILFSCKDGFDPYERPDWLAGKVYSQLKEVEELSTFAKCLELTGYDKVVDQSGSYTIFAPNNEAFDLYFSSNSSYSKVEDIPLEVLTNIVKYHIVQNPWSRQQLRSLDVNGWIDPEDEYNDKPRGYKRETLLLKDDSKYGVKPIPNERDEFMIVDTTETSWTRRVATDSRKYAPIFYAEYFQLYNLQLSDYTYYFDRNFDSVDDIYYVNAKVLGDEIFAENGFVYTIDRLVEPLKNANEILRSKSEYSKFLDLVNQFPYFNYNEDKTFDQAGASEGLVVDSLFDLTYPELSFNITSEKTKAPSNSGLPEEVSIRFHHGLIAPTNQAFDDFINQYVKGNNQWGSLDAMPIRIKKIIANTYFSQNPIYETDIAEGFYNGELDVVHLNTGSITQKEYGSNCTFIGVNEALVPRAFKSITGPVYRQTGYKTVMNAIEFCELLSALKREGAQNMFFVVPDSKLRLDSSLFRNYSNVNGIERESYYALLLAPAMRNISLDANELRLLFLNQVAIESPNGLARKEFLETMAGNHIVWDNVNNSVRGTGATTFGFNGTQSVTLKPVQISTDTDNGNTYSVDNWFSFTNTAIYSKISSNFPAFHALLVKAGFALDKEYRYSFLSENKHYTILAPSDEALAAISADTLTGKNLEYFLRLHFIQDELIFTDGRKAEGYYKTTCSLPVEGTTKSKDVEMYIQPGIDKISVMGTNGSAFMTVQESDNTNIVTSRSLNVDVETDVPNIMTTAVVHKIEKALLLNQIDVK